MDAFGREALESHNRYRAHHGARPLTWSSSIAREAENWARKLAQEGRLRHADCNDGENIFMCFGKGDVGGEYAVDSWYSEIKNYNYGRPGFQSNTGHFTQVVWNDSREFGIGKAKSRDGKLFVVGRYRPAGNNLRYFSDNVFPKGGRPPTSGKTPSRDESGPKRQQPTRLNNANEFSRVSVPISSRGNKVVKQYDDDEFERYRKMFEPEPQRSKYETKTVVRTKTSEDDEFDRYKKMFTENSNKHVSPSARRAADRPGDKSRAFDRNQWQTHDMDSGKQDVGTRKFVTRTQRDGGGYEERTETVTESADGSKRTVVSTITVSMNRNGSNQRPGQSPLSGFPKDMNRDLPRDERRYVPSFEKGKTSPSQSTVAKSSSSSQKDFATQSLTAHNRCRAAHGVLPMKWSEQLAREAQAWAQKLANERCLRHASKSERNDCGENIAMFTGKFDEAGAEATNMWYEEVKDYNFRKSGFQSNTGHFTQVVWKGSKELGMGRASTSDGRLTFVVGRYRPAGNIIGHFDDNVFRKTR